MASKPVNPEKEKVVDETVNKFLTQKMGDGSIRIRTGGRVVTAETFWKALKALAESEQEDLEKLPEHLREDWWNSIYCASTVLDSIREDETMPDYDLKAFPDIEVMQEIDEILKEELGLPEGREIVGIKATNEVLLKDIPEQVEND